MGYRQKPSRLQRRIGIIVLGMAAAIAVTPLVLALAIRSRTTSPWTRLLVAAGILWLLAVLAHLAFSRAHERWRRKTLRAEIARARKARLDSNEMFQDRLHEQSAVLDRIAEISDSILAEGIIDPITVLQNIRLMNSHAHEAKGLIDDAIAEARIETGSQSFNMEPVNIRTEIEHIAAPFIRGGRRIATGGPEQFAQTDAAVFRLIVRGLVANAVESDADEVDISVARDGALVICTVADDAPDRSAVGTDALSPLAKSLADAVEGELKFGRALGWNQYSISLPVGVASLAVQQSRAPIDVLGSLPTSMTSLATPSPPRSAVPDPLGGALDPDTEISFPVVIDRERAQTVAARRKRPVATR